MYFQVNGLLNLWDCSCNWSHTFTAIGFHRLMYEITPKNKLKNHIMLNNCIDYALNMLKFK